VLLLNECIVVYFVIKSVQKLLDIPSYRPPMECHFCNTGKLKNLSLLLTTISTWATSMKGTEWLIAIQLVGEHGSRQKK
jgi:hypothetical protein